MTSKKPTSGTEIANLNGRRVGKTVLGKIALIEAFFEAGHITREEMDVLSREHLGISEGSDPYGEYVARQLRDAGGSNDDAS